jgi:hypothetical protein
MPDALDIIRHTIDAHEQAEMQLIASQWHAVCACDADLGPVPAGPLIDSSHDETLRLHEEHRAKAIRDALADAGVLVQPDDLTRAEVNEMFHHNAKLHNDMRRRIQRVATHAASEQRTLLWVSDELLDILSDPLAWQGETARGLTDATGEVAADGR